MAVFSGSVNPLAADTRQKPAGDSVIEEIKERKVMRVGISMFMPWAMRAKDGGLIGFEIDVAKKVAADIDVDIEFVPTAWSRIIPALLARKFDVIISGMSITPARNLTVNFTIPYGHSGQQLVAGRKLAGGMSVEELNSPKVTIVCRLDSTPCATARKIFPKANIRRFDDDARALKEVFNGRAHAFITSAPKPRFWTQKYPETLFMPTEEILERFDEAMALRKGDPDAINFFNNWIRIHTRNGWLKARHEFWFTTQDWAEQVRQ